MDEYRFFYPIQVRYGDIDAQWHVNHAHTVTFIEQSRFAYLMALGLFDGKNYFEVGVIVADLHVSYLAPIEIQQNVRVGVRMARIGSKSMTLEYLVEDADSGQALAKAETVMVAYDYHSRQSIPVPDRWREIISAHEGRTF